MPRKSKAASKESFGQMADLLRKAGVVLKSPAKPTVPPVQKATVAQAGPSQEPEKKSEEELFTEAMTGVHRASFRPCRHATIKPSPSYTADPDAEARRLMQAALEPDTPIRIPDHPEYIEGWVDVAGKRYLPKLRDGIYSIQGQIDLHGLGLAEAQRAVEEYIVQMSRFHPCCIKIIHGRGINSPGDTATLKEGLQRLLSIRRMSRYVVAYASAPYRDGGVGAVYVLLHPQ
jgi:DNA-nicking Smr family endonuclease